MTVNSSSNNNMSYTSTSGVHDKPDDAIEKEYSKNWKTINIQFKMLMLTMMLNNLEHQEK